MLGSDFEIERGDYVFDLSFIFNHTTRELTAEVLGPIDVSICNLRGSLSFYSDLKQLTDYAIAVWLCDNYIDRRLKEVYDEDKEFAPNEPTSLDFFMDKYFSEDKDRSFGNMSARYIGYVDSIFTELVDFALKHERLYRVDRTIKLRPLTEEDGIEGDIWFTRTPLDWEEFEAEEDD